MNIDTLITNGKVWVKDQLLATNIGITDGKISFIGDPDLTIKSENIIDAKGNLVLPGAIDSHVHGRDDGYEYREDFYSLTKAAANSGITTVFDMPMGKSPVNCVENFHKKVELLSGRAYVDFALYGGAGIHNIDKIQELAKAGIVAFKTFTFPIRSERVNEFKGCFVDDTGQLFAVIEEIGKTDAFLAIHAENEEIVRLKQAKFKAEGRNDYYAYVDARPPIVESQMVASCIEMAKNANAAIHICHVSHVDSLEMIKRAKKEGRKVTCEIAVMYLFLTEEDGPKQFPYLCLYPRLFGQENKKALYEGYLDGSIDIVNSDHAPFTAAEIEIGLKDVFSTPPGGTNLEVMVPLLLNEVNNGKIPLQRLAETVMEKPARLFGIYPQKGVIQIGSDADIIIVDMEKTKTFTQDSYHIKQKKSQFDGWRVKGIPVLTMVRGKVVMKDGEIVGHAGWGKVVKPLSGRR